MKFPFSDAIQDSTRPKFNRIGTPTAVNVAQSYEKQAQITRFNEVFGRSQKYFTSKAYMARGHLAPDADFIFTSGQYATSFLANTVPTYQSINNGNWKSVEFKTRKLATQEQAMLEIYTGAHGHLKLLSSSGDEVPVYLSEGNKLEVPEYLFKVVYNPKRRAAIVFVTWTNPFPNQKRFHPFCTDVCAEANLAFEHNTLAAGRTICCAYDDFAQNVRIKTIHVERLLRLEA